MPNEIVVVHGPAAKLLPPYIRNPDAAYFDLYMEVDRRRAAALHVFKTGVGIINEYAYTKPEFCGSSADFFTPPAQLRIEGNNGDFDVKLVVYATVQSLKGNRVPFLDGSICESISVFPTVPEGPYVDYRANPLFSVTNNGFVSTTFDTNNPTAINNALCFMLAIQKSLSLTYIPRSQMCIQHTGIANVIGHLFRCR